MRLRSMCAADLARVMLIEKAAYPFPWTLQMFKDCLRVGYCAEVLEVDECIIAYGLMSVAAGEAQIFNLCVHPKRQGCGYGRLMLEHLVDISKEKAASVFLEVRLSNEVAINLYQNMGFNQVGVRKRYYPNGENGREDGLIFVRNLDS